MTTHDYAQIGAKVMQRVNAYNDKGKNEYRQFVIGDGLSFDALLDLYNYSNEFFFINSATGYSEILHNLLKAAILLKPEYSTNVTSEEDKLKPREDWEGPVTVQLNVDQVGELFFFLELITKFISDMQHGSDRIKRLVDRYKLEDLKNRDQ